jgi:mannose-6-phosphate isomerase-like protein (cupin superfamily)
MDSVLGYRATVKDSIQLTKPLVALLVTALAGLSGLAQDSPRRQPKTFVLNCAGGDCPLLTGAPQTAGMRGGSVKLKPGESVGWHSTSQNEETLVILRGSGVAKIDGHSDMPFSEKMLVYIPPLTRHNVVNNGSQTLEYVWIVAPAKTPIP